MLEKQNPKSHPFDDCLNTKGERFQSLLFKNRDLFFFFSNTSKNTTVSDRAAYTWYWLQISELLALSQVK